MMWCSKLRQIQQEELLEELSDSTADFEELKHLFDNLSQFYRKHLKKLIIKVKVKDSTDKGNLHE